MTKYIFVTGGVVSSLGKGIATASLGLLLKRRGLSVTLQKFDPYLNVDPGTMSPFQHGEVFVTDDGTETDLDLGHYERFTDVSLGRQHNTTAGQVYESLIRKERRGDFLGHTVQVVPHVTDAIKERIEAAADGNDIVVTEIGGTVGDIESLPFLEAVRQFRLDVGPQHCIDVHLTLVPYIRAAKEVKTKPTQHSVATMRSIGLQPDVLLCRTEMPLAESVLRKIGQYCNVPTRAVIALPDVRSIYDVPLLLSEQKLDQIVLERLGLEASPLQLDSWHRMVERLHAAREEVEIAVCGKYVDLQDAYKSIIEALTHAGVDNDVVVRIRWVNSEEVEGRGAAALLRGVDGVLVPGGFGERGIEGKIAAIRWARENRVPLFGICLGLQCAVIEFARNVLQLPKANSSEFEPSTPDAVIDLMPDQEGVAKGGTMRLGAYPCVLEDGSLAARSYGESQVHERHRHRWEVNPAYTDKLESGGMKLSGISPDGRLVEIVEIPEHPFFLAVQFHPELKSRPERPHPLFSRFVAAACVRRSGAAGSEARAAKAVGN